MTSTRHFSTKSIRLLADDIHSNLAAVSVDHFLNTLANIDAQIHDEFNVLKADLAAARAGCVAANERCNALQLENVRCKSQLAALHAELCQLKPRSTPSSPSSQPCSCAENAAQSNGANVVPTAHSPTCAVRIATLSKCTPERLVELLVAREHAFNNQQRLVHRLKLDNADLKSTYDNLLLRYQTAHQKEHPPNPPPNPPPNLHRLSKQLENVGNAACQAASTVEQRLQVTAKNITAFRQSIALRAPSAPAPTQSANPIKDEYDVESDAEEESHANACVAAADELISTLAAQKVAHERLRNTVIQLTAELQSVAQTNQNHTEQLSEKLATTESNLRQLNSQLEQKDHQIADLKKQLNKVLAEYQAVSVAHSYSNAELSRIRANNRAKTKDRQFNDRHDRHDRYDRPHGLINGAENRLHHRKIHFR